MTPLEQAEEILTMNPLPDDARKRITALEKEADEIEKLQFPWIWEGLDIQEGEVSVR